MRNPVVVGVTGTPAGLAAVRLAAREALSRGRQLRVIHAFTWPCPRPPGAGLDHWSARRAAVRVVEDAVTTAQRSTPGVRVSGQLVDGAPDRVLVGLSRTAELIVVGGDELATTRRLPSGSAVLAAVTRSWCPVLVARGPRPPAGPVLAAVDGSAPSLLALRYAVAEARRRQAVLEVVHVSRETGPRAQEAAQRVLDAAVAAVPGLSRSRCRVLTGAPGAVLVRASGRARLIVLGPHGAQTLGAGTLGAGVLGAVAREVLHRGACPAAFVHGRLLPAPRRGGHPVGARGSTARLPR